jgi:hypothetical protein
VDAQNERKVRVAMQQEYEERIASLNERLTSQKEELVRNRCVSFSIVAFSWRYSLSIS